ncbi:hypothetical protein LUZ60_011509 [Juncus effusus]|nr:hypothetical protein LUZ60_011509 [Juncus effusus]
MEVSKDQMSLLLDNGLFDSAQMLGCFLVSSAASNAEPNPYIKAEHYVLQGDAFYGGNEYRRALAMYKQALLCCKNRQIGSSTRTSISATNRSPSPSSINPQAINENEVKFKIALCHSALNEHRSALLEMEGIPSKLRSIRMNLAMGKLYRIARNNRAASSCYKECLRQLPYVLEAVNALAELGVSSKEILLLFSQTPAKAGRFSSEQSDSQRWLTRYVEAQCCIASNDYKGGLDIFAELLSRFPNNVHILLEMAKVETIIGRNEEAILYFEKVRMIDPHVMTYMDEYAILLKSKPDQSKLNKLVHDMLSTEPGRPETLVAMAAHWERKDAKRAFAYADKCVKIDERHIAGHIMKGNLYMSLNRPDCAVVEYKTAQDLRADLRSYQGLVRAYLAFSKPKEALFNAREAMKAMQQSAKALKLVGDVHAISTNGREKARKFYESALRLEPGFLGAALALADLHVAEGRNKEAVSLLEKYLKNWADDSLHIKLAQVFAATNMLSDALSHYQAALRINPGNEAAKKGLERLEKQMKGMDPDAPEEEEDNEADDGEGDQEEADLL